MAVSSFQSMKSCSQLFISVGDVISVVSFSNISSVGDVIPVADAFVLVTFRDFGMKFLVFMLLLYFSAVLITVHKSCCCCPF